MAFTTQPEVAAQDSGGATATTDNTTVVTLSLEASTIREIKKLVASDAEPRRLLRHQRGRER